MGVSLNLHPSEMRAYDFIRQYITENDGVSPSFREIMRGVGLKSVGHIAEIMDTLERARLLRRTRGRRRAIELAEANKLIPIFDADTLALKGYLP